VGCDIYLDVIALMIVTTFSEQPVMHNAVDVKLVKKRVAILRTISRCYTT
jgi:hypothetical protein